MKMRIAWLVYVAGIIFPLFAVPYALGQTAPPSPEAGYTLRVNVGEVVLHATVQNRRGTPVAGLTANAFQVFEDRVLQPITHFSHEDIPVTVGLVIDNSGSMRPKRAEVIAAALAFAGSSNPKDEMFLVNFNEHVSFGLSHETPFTDQREQLKVAMSTVISDGRTALYDAVAVALEHLKNGSRDKKILIVVSDGADNASKRTKSQMMDLAKQSDAIVYALGIYEPDDPDRSPGVLSELTRTTGGQAYFPEELKDVLPICERIAHEVRNQYTIVLSPTNQKVDGAYRSIDVRAGHGLHVITRAGYLAPSKATPAAPEAHNR